MPFFNPGNNTSMFIPNTDWNRGTYRELLSILKEVPEEMLDQTVTLQNTESDEYIPAQSIGWTGPGCRTLGNQHMFISF
jgi:hypothetical protein